MYCVKAAKLNKTNQQISKYIFSHWQLYIEANIFHNYSCISKLSLYIIRVHVFSSEQQCWKVTSSQIFPYALYNYNSRYSKQSFQDTIKLKTEITNLEKDTSLY